MTNIRPFKGIHYNLDKMLDLSRLTCPPYDVIDKDQQDFYYAQNPYNFIRLILNKEEPRDDNLNNRYVRASKFFDEWLKMEILKQDQDEALYFYKQDYFYNDKELFRLGFIGLLQIQDSGNVFGHENTHQAPKIDRLELIKNVKSNLTPIFTIFSDRDKIIKEIFDKFLNKRQPDLLLKDVEGIRHSIWRVCDKQIIERICGKMRDNQIFIADGHHRYEVAAMYLKLMQDLDKDYSVNKGYNYIMTYFTDLESSGLCIMPVHRVIKSEIDASRLKNIFRIEELDSIADLDDKLASSSKKGHVFGFINDDRVLLLESKDKEKIYNQFIENKCFGDLDVAVLDYYVLTKLLNLDKSDIIYTKEISEAKELIDSKEANAAFILRPLSVSQIKDVALCQERMPPKSTYFYPKLLSGLVVHKFSEDKS